LTVLRKGFCEKKWLVIATLQRVKKKHRHTGDNRIFFRERKILKKANIIWGKVFVEIFFVSVFESFEDIFKSRGVSKTNINPVYLTIRKFFLIMFCLVEKFFLESPFSYRRIYKKDPWYDSEKWQKNWPHVIFLVGQSSRRRESIPEGEKEMQEE
jgi:hypothetical protein